MKNILVLSHDGEAQEGLLRAALTLAEAMAGQLSCLAAERVVRSLRVAEATASEAHCAGAPLADYLVVDNAYADVALRYGRPFLVVPPDTCGLELEGAALVAWDGSHHANQALSAAVPLLRSASEVCLFAVNLSSARSLERAAGELARKGIRPRTVEKTTRAPVADSILERVQLAGAAYLVMGAFGQKQGFERKLGSVTREILHRCNVPVLVAH